MGGWRRQRPEEQLIRRTAAPEKKGAAINGDGPILLTFFIHTHYGQYDRRI